MKLLLAASRLLPPFVSASSIILCCRLTKAERNKCWHVLIWLLTIILLGVSVAISYILFRFYSVCSENRVISVANVAACCLLLVLTLIPGIGRGRIHILIGILL